MSRVIVVQAPSRGIDLTSARDYGDMHFLIPDPQFQPSLQPGVARKRMEDSLFGLKFDPEEDYVLSLGGDICGAIMFGMLIRELYPNREIKMLRWERSRRGGSEGEARGGYYVPTVYK